MYDLAIYCHFIKLLFNIITLLYSYDAYICYLIAYGNKDE